MTPATWQIGKFLGRKPGRFQPRWYHAYLLLALLDLVTVSGSLYLNDRLARRSVRMIDMDQRWAQLSDDFAELGQLSVAVNNPGNNVFETADTESERVRLRLATEAFQARLSALQKKVSDQAPQVSVAQLLDDLSDLEQLTLAMSELGEKVLHHYGRGEFEDAARTMAEMDRKLMHLTAVVTTAESQVTQIQAELFKRHMEAVHSLQRYEAVIAALIGAMIVGAAWYGLRTLREQRQVKAMLVTANADLERRVEERTADLRQARLTRDHLLQGLFTAQEDERRRISRELHDGIGQLLATLRMQMHAQADQVNDEHCRLALEDMRRIVGDAIDEVRNLSHGLRPSVLDDIGLIPALERLASDVNQTGLATVELKLEEAPQERLPEEVETAVYRIVQEALTNALRHAAARRVRVELLHDAEAVEVSVVDDGVGFQLESAEVRDHGLGLLGMRERAELLHGRLSIDSHPGHGTRVCAAIPYRHVMA